MFSDELPLLNSAYTVHELGSLESLYFDPYCVSDRFTDARDPDAHQPWLSEQNCTSSSKYYEYKNLNNLFDSCNDHLKVLSHNIRSMKQNFENLYNDITDFKFDIMNHSTQWNVF